jgi:hypothetical protein
MLFPDAVLKEDSLTLNTFYTKNVEGLAGPLASWNHGIFWLSRQRLAGSLFYGNDAVSGSLGKFHFQPVLAFVVLIRFGFMLLLFGSGTLAARANRRRPSILHTQAVPVSPLAS